MDDSISRSKSSYYADNRLDLYQYGGPLPPTAQAGARGMQDLRCYSTEVYQSHSVGSNQIEMSKVDPRLKKGKSTNGSVSKSWSLNDPEFQRKKRVASYKAYTVEGKVKGSFRKSFRWLKDRYSRVVYGWW